MENELTYRENLVNDVLDAVDELTGTKDFLDGFDQFYEDLKKGMVFYVNCSFSSHRFEVVSWNKDDGSVTCRAEVIDDNGKIETYEDKTEWINLEPLPDNPLKPVQKS